MKAFLIFPCHISPIPEHIKKEIDYVVLIEDFLFFNQYNFHKQKIALHRASMKSYEADLINAGIKTIYVDAKQTPKRSSFAGELKKHAITDIVYFDPVDYHLSQTLKKLAPDFVLTELESPLFLHTTGELSGYHELYSARKPKMAHFYEYVRKQKHILMNDENTPINGAWSFDSENRKKIPKGEILPESTFTFTPNNFWIESVTYTEENFPNNIGIISEHEQFYPTNEQQAKKMLEMFIEVKLEKFGPYEDAILSQNNELWHSGISSCLNNGLLPPEYVVKQILKHYEKHPKVSYPSIEGFIRQIIGWREFMRYMYVYYGVSMRTKNFWNHTKKIPEPWYTGTTGIDPVDDAIHFLKKTAYNHHIVRLMVLGNSMLLSEFHPDSVYTWFMEHYIDAYDWVMVPNVYGMSQFADGGIFATKPYICASNYILKMSNYKKGLWSEAMDSLFWNFLRKHKKFLSKNPRLAMLLNSKKMFEVE